jgi:predicted outer membrane protein
MKTCFLMSLASVLAALLISCSSQSTQTTASQQNAATTSTPAPAQDIRHMPVMGGMRGGY